VNIEIKVNGEQPSKDVERFVRCRSELALQGMRDEIVMVSVAVDHNGEYGGDREISCLVLVRLIGHPDVGVEIADANLYTAIHRALDDAGWCVAGNLVRRQRELLQQQVEMIDGDRSVLPSEQRIRSERAA
jgi:hypothetical protein